MIPAARLPQREDALELPKSFPSLWFWTLYRGPTEDLNSIDDEETQLSMCKGALAQPLPSETLVGISFESHVKQKRTHFHVSAQLGLSEQRKLEPEWKDKSWKLKGDWITRGLWRNLETYYSVFAFQRCEESVAYIPKVCKCQGFSPSLKRGGGQDVAYLNSHINNFGIPLL